MKKKQSFAGLIGGLHNDVVHLLDLTILPQHRRRNAFRPRDNYHLLAIGLTPCNGIIL